MKVFLQHMAALKGGAPTEDRVVSGQLPVVRKQIPRSPRRPRDDKSLDGVPRGTIQPQIFQKQGSVGHPRRTPLRGWDFEEGPMRGLTPTPNTASQLRRLAAIGKRDILHSAVCQKKA
jgi:hypothetical protein